MVPLIARSCLAPARDEVVKVSGILRVGRWIAMDDQARANELIEQANALHNAGDVLEAAPLYIEAGALFAPYAQFSLVAGDTLLDHGDHERAAAAYQIVVAEMPDHDQARAGLKAAQKGAKGAGKRRLFARK